MAKVSAKILVIDDDPDILNAARVVLKQKFETVVVESHQQKISFLLSQNKFDVILLDMNFSPGRTTGNEGLYWLNQILSATPNQAVILLTAYGDINVAVEAMKKGATDFIVKPWDNEKLIGCILAALEREEKKIKSSGKKSEEAIQLYRNPIGESIVWREMLQKVEKVAPTDANVLLLGENGTGKELIAEYLHLHSHRKNFPFIKVDVGAVSGTLFESELFGHRKGAFTDAKEDRVGRFQSADKGSLFLDEVGNLPLSLQVKLLSILQNRKVVPLGSNHEISFDVRVISATNANIHQQVAQGQFREDLLYRINTIEITLPALRDRVDDIPVLADHFLTLYCEKYGKELKIMSKDAVRFLQKYSWPGNVRELQHAVERAVIMSDSVQIESSDFILTGRNDTSQKKEAMSLDEMEEKAITDSLRKNNGNMSKVAKELGLGRTTLYRKLLKYGIVK
jgi:two-component system, NtrC family, response regulator HydG